MGEEKTELMLDQGFRIVVGRRPDKPEQEILGRILSEQLQHFQQDAKAAQALVSQGSVDAKGLDPARLAAWISVANVLLNLDEAITRE